MDTGAPPVVKFAGRKTKIGCEAMKDAHTAHKYPVVTIRPLLRTERTQDKTRTLAQKSYFKTPVNTKAAPYSY